MTFQLQLQRFLLSSIVLLLTGAVMASAVEAQRAAPPPPGVPPAPPAGVPPTLHDRGNVPPPWFGDPPRGQPPTVPGRVNSEAFASEVHAITEALTNGAVTAVNGRGLSLTVQRAVLGTLGGLAPSEALEARLAPENNRDAAEHATLLVESLDGLLSDPDRLGEAAAAFNALIDSSSAEFLSDPPPELLTIQAALARLISAAAVES